MGECMVDDLENKDWEEKDEKEESSEEKSPKGVLINLKTIIIGAGVFVICLAAFSFVMGVFSPAKEQPAQEPGAVEEALGTAPATEDNGNRNVETEWGEGYVEDPQDPDVVSSDSVLTEEDSTAHMVWYLAQRQEIEEERTIIRIEAAKLKNLKMEYETLINRVEGIEHENIINMAKLFETMKAEEVASIMENIPNAKVGMILQKMKKQSASKVMASLPSERAARITMELIDIDGTE